MRAMTQSFIKPAEPLPLPREWHSAVFVSIGDDRLRRGAYCYGGFMPTLGQRTD